MSCNVDERTFKIARTKNKNKQLPRNSKSKEKGKKGGSKANTRRNQNIFQKKTVVQENIDQNEDVLERSEHSDGNVVSQQKTITGDNNHVEENIFDDEIYENVRSDLTENTVDNGVN